MANAGHEPPMIVPGDGSPVERFDEWRLVQAVESVRGGTSAEVVDAIAGSIGAFQGCDEVADDITIVAIRRSVRPAVRRSACR